MFIHPDSHLFFQISYYLNVNHQCLAFSRLYYGYPRWIHFIDKFDFQLIQSWWIGFSVLFFGFLFGILASKKFKLALVKENDVGEEKNPFQIFLITRFSVQFNQIYQLEIDPEFGDFSSFFSHYIGTILYTSLE